MPPATFKISSQARRLAQSVTSGSSGRSNRKLDGLNSPSARDVRRTDIGSNWAASIRTLVVRGPISVSAPPITPASPTGRAASAITSISGLSS